MSWSWAYHTNGSDTDFEGLPQETFSSQSDAESWVGETWRELLDAGVKRVTLLHDGVESYHMSLEPAD